MALYTEPHKLVVSFFSSFGRGEGRRGVKRRRTGRGEGDVGRGGGRGEEEGGGGGRDEEKRKKGRGKEGKNPA